MNTASKHLQAATLGTLAALATGTAVADDIGDKAALTTTASEISVEARSLDGASYKYGEYNGLRKGTGYFDGSLDLRGGGSYEGNDASRWRLTLKDIGLPTASGQGEYGRQGSWRLSAGFDTIPHYAGNGDSYYTPYLGAGTAHLTLPSNWLVPVVPRVSTTAPNARGLSGAVTNSSAIVSGVLTAPTNANAATALAIQNADRPDFQRFGLSTNRYRYDVGLAATAASKWDFSVNARREDRNGTKLLSTVSRASGGDISTALADPIAQRTDQLTAQVGWHDNKRNFLQFTYYASVFKNDITGLTWQNWAVQAPTLATMSSSPNNNASQFAVAGGHGLWANTRLTGSLAYTRTTQNQAYLTDATTVLVPQSSLNGKVDTTTGTLKLTSRPLKALTVNLGYRYDYRANETQVATYGYYDANEAAGGTAMNAAFQAYLTSLYGVTGLKSNTNINASRPYSRKLSAVSLDGRYQLGAGQVLSASYDMQQLDRFCKGSWISCADAASTNENTLGLELGSTWTDALHSRFSYVNADRTVDAYNENAFLALVPLANVSPTGATGGATAYSYMVANGWNAWGPALGYLATTGNANLFFPSNNAMANAMYQNQNRISELPGMRRYNMANRKRDKIRGEVDWQAAARLGLQASVDYRNDRYSDSRYGLVGERDAAGNFEAQFNATENIGLVAFYTHELQVQDAKGNSYTANSNTANVNTFTAISGGCFSTIQTRNNNNKIDPCTNWSTHMATTSDIVGLTLDLKGLLPSHKLDLSASGLASRSHSGNDPVGGNYVNNPLAVAGAAAGTTAAYYIAATSLPEYYANSCELRLVARYAVSTAGTVKLGYSHANYKSSDYGYDGFQYGGLAGVLPTLQVAPHYTIDAFSLAYSARF